MWGDEEMTGKEEYLNSLTSDKLQRFILDNLELPEEELIEKCVDFLRGEKND